MLDVPTGQTSGGYRAAARLHDCARTSRAAATQWEAAAAPAWSGEAAAGFDHARMLLSRHTRDLVDVADVVGDAVQTYAQEMAVVLPMWRASVDDWHRARSRELDDGDPMALQQNTFDAEMDVVRWHGRYEAAGLQLSDAARRAVQGLQPYSGTARQIDEGLRTFVHVGIVEPIQTLGFLALGWVTDTARWQKQVTSMPAAAGEAARHPWDTFRAGALSAVGAEHFRSGRWGAGIGTLAAGLVGGKGLGKGLKGKPVDARTMELFPGAVFAGHLGVPSAQTVDEMLTDGVDLSRHEHTNLGHTLRRHVNVTDEYLADRLDHGTILDTERRGRIPSAASAWNDLETAEASVTQVLRDREPELRSLRLVHGRSTEAVHWTVGDVDGPIIGRSMWDDTGGRHVADVAQFTVVLEPTSGGTFTVITAYPTRGTP